LTANGDAKVGDVQGQFNFPDGTAAIPALGSEGYSYRHPTAPEDEHSERKDLFAFGISLHHLWHGRDAFHEIDELSNLGRFGDIRARYRNNDFPPLNCAPGIAQIIENCWKSKYQHSHEMLHDLQCWANGLFPAKGEEPLRPRRRLNGPSFHPIAHWLLQQQREAEAAAGTSNRLPENGRLVGISSRDTHG
jgi:hypothetical protein